MKGKKSAALAQNNTPLVSLSSLFLGKSSKAARLDTELDDIFKSSAGVTLPRSSESARLMTNSNPDVIASVESGLEKASKRKGMEMTESVHPIPKKRRKFANADELTHEHIGSVQAAAPDTDSAKGQHDTKGVYFARSHKGVIAGDGVGGRPLHARHGESYGEDENIVPLQHESLIAKTPKRGSKNNTKYALPGETREQRDERTIFIGNLPTRVAKTKPALHGLQRLISSAVPGCKIESTRFRSVAFQNPTSELPKLDGESSKPITSSTRSGPPSDDLGDPTSRQARQLGRAALWREQEDIESEKPANATTFITHAEKKRIAFIKGELHSEAATLHAYIVFAHEAPGRSKNVPPVMNPFEAAKRAVEVCNGMVYMDRTIRVDHVRTSDTMGDTRRPGHFDPRRTIFVGGLDFQTNEEDLRTLFENLLIAETEENGDDDDESSESNSDGDDKNEDKSNKTAARASWVTHVRIIRDKETQLGKGIAYVEFKERGALDEIMAVDQGKLKLNKRKIRVERCKNISSMISRSLPRPTAGERGSKLGRSSLESRNKERALRSDAAGIPQGDPTLGDRLRGLDKDARRAAKAADPSRQARRLAKKARHALGNAGVRTDKSKSAAAVLGNMKPLGKSKVKAKVSRVRSSKSAAKRNVKK